MKTVFACLCLLSAFVPAVAGVGAGGFYSYVPLPYKEPLKVVVKSDHFNFYQINYATYPAGAGVESYTPEPSAEFKAPLERAWLTHAEVARGGRLFLRTGDKPSRWGGANRPPSLGLTGQNRPLPRVVLTRLLHQRSPR